MILVRLLPGYVDLLVGDVDLYRWDQQAPDLSESLDGLQVAPVGAGGGAAGEGTALSAGDEERPAA